MIPVPNIPASVQAVQCLICPLTGHVRPAKTLTSVRPLRRFSPWRKYQRPSVRLTGFDDMRSGYVGERKITSSSSQRLMNGHSST